VLIQDYLALARLRQAQGDRAGATRLLAELMQRAEQCGLVSAMIGRIAAAQAELALAQADHAAALRWAGEAGVTIADAENYWREAELLTLARVWIAQGGDNPAGPELPDALALLARLRASAEQQRRVDSLITIDILRARALAAQGHTPAALDALEQALTAGASAGYVRRFLDEGAPMATLLQAIQSNTTASQYVAMLLAAFPRTENRGLRTESVESIHSVLSPQSSELIEPLTARELEVLRLLAAGRSTAAIAQELIVGEGTVKRHVSNLMGKLDVHSRLEAVARARALGLVS
jgi:LuxR family maltose regulon positive regulatory protein